MLLSKSTYSAFRLYMFCQYVFPGNRTHNLWAANAMLYHWATGISVISTISDTVNMQQVKKLNESLFDVDQTGPV